MSKVARVGLYFYPHDPFWVLVREAIAQRAEQVAIQLVPVNIDRKLHDSEQAQANLVEELLAQELQALITSFIPESLVERLLDAGLPVIFNSEASIRHPRFVTPQSLYTAAQMIGHYLAERLSGRGTVLIAGGLMSPGDNGQSRIAGLCDVLREFPAICLRHIPSPWTRAFPYFEAAMKEMTEPVDAIFGLSDSLALSARDAGRADLGILRLADQIWVSDNTEAAARLGIQEGYSHIFPANTMEAWVTDMGRPPLPLEFRMHVSMCGSLGIGGHLLHWTEEQRAEAAKWIAVYKDIRPIIQFGDLYRLRSPQAHAFSAVQYISKDRAEGVLFAFRTHLPFPAQLPSLYLRGLEPDSLYEIERLGTRSGLAWMHAGLELELRDFTSTVRRIRRVNP